MKELVRLEALTDGVFAIVATLLVLDIKLPDFPLNQNSDAFAEFISSFIAFTFSFITVMIYWVNHDHISRWRRGHNSKAIYLNLVFLFFICLIPFPTKFIAKYPNEMVAVISYGIEMFMVAVSGIALYWYLAFHGKLLDHSIPMKTRKNYLHKAYGGPSLYLLAILLGFVSYKISIALYIIIPLLYVVLPKTDLKES